MVLSITPAVRGGRENGWLRTALLHVLGGAFGGAVIGFTLAPLTRVPISRDAWLVLAVASAFGALGDIGVTPALYPSPRRQVPERWRRFLPRDAAAFLYGVGLGTAFFTRIRSAAVFAIVAVAAASGDPWLSIIAYAAYGSVRATSAVLLAARNGPYERVLHLLDELDRTRRVAGTAGAVVTTFLLGAYVAQAVT